MAPRTTPPFRADHVGSLLRPSELLRAREDFTAGTISAEALRTVEDEAIRDAVRCRRRSVSRPPRTVSSGAARGTWTSSTSSTGSARRATVSRCSSATTRERSSSTRRRIRVDGRVGLSRTIFGADYEALSSFVTTATPKLTIPSPSMVHYRGGRSSIDEGVYPDLDEFWSDLTAAYREEIRRLGELGCTYLQLDDTSLSYLNDPKAARVRRRSRRRPRAPAPRVHPARERGARRSSAGDGVTTHTCRGNFRSSWVAEGGYDFVAEPLFSELQVDGFFLEYDDERSGGFEPLRFVPKEKLVVLGLVTTKRGELETKDELKRRIDEAVASSISSSCASRLSAGSHPRWRATPSATTRRSRSCALSSRRRATYGAESEKRQRQPSGDSRPGRELGRVARCRRLGALPDGVARGGSDDGDLVPGPGRRVHPGQREGFDRGVRILHFLGGTSIDVAGDRAVAQTKMTISQRADVHDVSCDVVCTGRFYDFLEQRDDVWGIVLRQPIYEQDRLDPVDPAARLVLDGQVLAALPGRLPASRVPADADRVHGQARHARTHRCRGRLLYARGAAWLAGTTTAAELVGGS